jgi:type I restriction enzyme M protein
MVDSDLIDCVVSLPSQLFYSTQIAVSLWLIANDKKPKDWRDRQNSILMIDARSMGHMVDRTRRELSKDEVSLISSTFHSWQGRPRSNVYHDIPGFCHSCSLPEVVKHEYALVPGRYVGFQPINLDEETLHSLRSEFLGTIDEVLEFANDLELSVLSVRSLLNG